MSYIVTPFEVSSKALGEPAKVRFVHLFPGIATRHRDSIDCLFLVNGKRVTVAISCATLAEMHDREGKFFSDQQLAETAARYLRRTLESGYDASEAELFLGGDELRALAKWERW